MFGFLSALSRYTSGVNEALSLILCQPCDDVHVCVCVSWCLARCWATASLRSLTAVWHAPTTSKLCSKQCMFLFFLLTVQWAQIVWRPPCRQQYVGALQRLRLNRGLALRRPPMRRNPGLCGALSDACSLLAVMAEYLGGKETLLYPSSLSSALCRHFNLHPAFSCRAVVARATTGEKLIGSSVCQ